MNKYLVLSFLLLGLISCNSGNNKVDQGLGYTVIDVGSDVGKGRVVDLSEIASEITYIPLETNRNSFIGRSPVVSFENERIYVRSASITNVFDKSGKYLFTFNRKGRGPEEYPDGRPLIEKGTGNFYIECMKGGNIGVDKVVKTYDRDGNFKREITMPPFKPFSKDRMLSLKEYLSNYYICRIIALDPSVNMDEDQFRVVLFDTLSNVIGYIPNPPLDPRIVSGIRSDIPLPEGRRAQNPAQKYEIGGVLHTFKDSIRMYTFYGDTIYTYIDSNRLKPRYFLDYGQYAPSKIYPNQITQHSGKLISLASTFYYETDNFLLLDFLLRDYAHEPFYGKKSYLHIKEQEIRDSYGYYNKITKQFTLLNHPQKDMPGFCEDIEKGPPFVPIYLSDDNYMLAVYYPQDLIDYASKNKVSEQLQTVIDGLKESDNLVIALVKLK